MTDYTSARAKLGRATEHLEELEAELRAWIDTTPLDGTPADRKGATEDWHIKITTPLPDRLNVIAGDCVHNFRCVFDHLAMAFAVSSGSSPDATDISFPIRQNPRDFAKCRWLRRLPQDARDFLASTQPYAQPSRGGWALPELQHLDNQDKHRFFLQLALRNMATFEPHNPDVRIVYNQVQILDDGAHYATVTYPEGYHGPREKPNLSVAICVQRSNRLGILELQRYLRVELSPFAAKVLSEAEQRFP
jgi:hypothetical protein